MDQINKEIVLIYFTLQELELFLIRAIWFDKRDF